MKLIFKLHWCLFDIINYNDDHCEWRCFFMKAIHKNNRICYYLDSAELGIQIYSNTQYTILELKLIAFTIGFQKNHKQRFKII
jgi:hypothetical protein